MNKLNIVLVEPQIPQNTGNISRTCAVTGIALHLIKPYGFEISDKHLKRAGLDYWDKLGREDKGLPEKLLFEHPDNCVRIPMRNELRSLNLSNSVAIACYEVLRQWDYPDLGREGKLTQYTW